MRSFTQYLAEATYAAENPVPGDAFDIELGELDAVIETTVSEIRDDGSVIVECDDVAVKLLTQYCTLVESADQEEYCDACDRPSNKCVCDDHDHMDEAKYQGREVPLGKPMAGDVKKSKVYVRKPNGNIVKVNFGDKTMKIKKSNPKRRKSFRARHNCANPGPRWKARYWSCRAW
jgi:hypothetical protein